MMMYMDFLYTTEETRSVDKIPEESCSESFFRENLLT